MDHRYFDKCVTSLTSWSRVLLEKLIVPHLVKNYPTFMEPKSSLPYFQKSVTEPYPEPVESNPF